MSATQLLLPFACLGFPGRSTVTVAEMAEKLGGTAQHYINLVDSGELTALDLSANASSRRMLRVPIDEYHRYVIAKLTSKERRTFIAELPRETLREIAAEIAARLAA